MSDDIPELRKGTNRLPQSLQIFFAFKQAP